MLFLFWIIYILEVVETFKDRWLVLESKKQCKDVIKRISRKDNTLCRRLGVPLLLVDGRWIQCVDGCCKFLTSVEKKAIVSFSSFKNKVLIV